MSQDFIDVKDVYPNDPFGESSEGIPTGRDVEWEPLVDYRRNGVSEKHGEVTRDMGGQRSTQEVGEAIAARVAG